MLNKSKFKQVLFAIALLLTIIAVLRFSDYEKLAEILRDSRYFWIGVLVYFVFTIASVIFPFVLSIPLWPVALVTYGFFPAIILTVLSLNIGALASFQLSRTLSRKYIEKLVGEANLKKFHELLQFAQIDKPLGFFLLRLFGNNMFDIVSYIAGISKIPMRWYIVITFVVSSAWTTLTFTILRYAFSTNIVYVYIYALIIYIVMIAMWQFFLKMQLTRDKK